MAVAAAAAAPPATAAPLPAGMRLRSLFAGTPGMLKASMAISLAAVVMFGVLAGLSSSSRRQSLISARQAAAQAVRIQQVHTSLVAADALATNAFLVGGLEPAEQRTGYENGISTAAQTLTAAANHADASDVAGLQQANAALADYTGLIESARANNRQLFPVGVAYLKQASALLLTDVLPVLDRVSASSEQRVSNAYDDSDNARYAFWISSVVVLAVLLVAQWKLSSVTRRTFNLPLVVATGLVLVAIIYGGAAMTLASSNADSARSGPYRLTTALATARIDAYAAKSAESLTLISRGNGTPFEAQWKQSYGTASAAIQSIDDPSLSSALSAYATVHVAIRLLDDSGNWDGAVAKATKFDSGSSNATFTTFAEASATRLDTAAADLDSRLADASGNLDVTLAVLFAFALLAAVAIGVAYAGRLREYR